MGSELENINMDTLASDCYCRAADVVDDFTDLVTRIQAFVQHTDQLHVSQQNIPAHQHEQWSREQSILWMDQYRIVLQGPRPGAGAVLLSQTLNLLHTAIDKRVFHLIDNSTAVEASAFDGRLWLSRDEWKHIADHGVSSQDQWYRDRRSFVEVVTTLAVYVRDFRNRVRLVNDMVECERAPQTEAYFNQFQLDLRKLNRLNPRLFAMLDKLYCDAAQPSIHLPVNPTLNAARGAAGPYAVAGVASLRAGMAGHDTRGW